MRVSYTLLLCILTGLFAPQETRAQADPYVLNGSATQNNCNCYTLTPDQYNESGSVWNKNKIDLTQSFDYHFNVFLGCNSNGADGIAFVLQPISTSIGTDGEGLGFGGVTPSLGVTIDTYQNADENDPFYDHIAFQANGDVNHDDANNLAGPVQALENSTDIKDCAWHVLEVSWNAGTMTLTAYMDGVLRLTMTKDIVQTIFQSNSMVFWGFTAATGGSDDLQEFCTSLNAHNTTAVPLGQHYCAGTPITFTDSSTSFGSIVSWTWNFGDGTSSTLQNPPPHLYPGPAVYPVQEIVVGNNGCSDTSTTDVTLGSYPVAAFSVNKACTDQPLTLVNGSTNDVGAFAQWDWTLSGTSGIQTFTDSLPSIVLNTPGSYSLQLSAVTAQGCASNTATGTFTVTVTPQVSFLGDSVCAGAPLTLTGVNENGASIQQWYWDIGTTIQDYGQTIQQTFPYAETLTALLWAVSPQGCVSDTFSQPIEVQQTHAFAGDDTTAAMGYPIQLNATGGTYYTWSPATNLNDPNIADPIATLTQDTRYTVTAYSPAGCPTSASILIKVFKGPAIFIPSAFTPNGDGANDVLKIVAPGIRQLIYFRVFDRWGKEVFYTTALDATWDGTLNGKPLPVGVYVWMVQARDIQGGTLTEKGTLTLIR